ncbi:hypothetical protein [Rhodococcus sp. UNC23MFCrub1.1]|uniref:hypothetical protein n=1 Tax=Rhodococcus sp. UNC23MFCrub1.1 TaxID=1449068 RepID=UPI000487FB74|nr:hypothetical protein [Rhodococcus sp. UNC23MFCrub1.1]
MTRTTDGIAIVLSIAFAAAFTAVAYWAAANAWRHLRQPSDIRPGIVHAAGWLSAAAVLALVFVAAWANESAHLTVGFCIGGLAAPLSARLFASRGVRHR